MRKQTTNIRSFGLLRVCAALLILAAQGRCVFAYVGAEAGKQGAEDSQLIINVDSIVQLIFGQNPEIAAARYAVKAAEYQFKDFERNLSQFTPILLRSSVKRDERSPDEDQEYLLRVGAEKDFFNGASVFAGVGHKGEFGDSGGAESQFVETNITLPLFSSNTTLRRITDRSREENEMINSRLDYIDMLREYIRENQERYYQLLLAREAVRSRAECLSDFRLILAMPRVQANAAERSQVESDIQLIQRDIALYEQQVKVRLLYLRKAIGLESLSLGQFEDVDFYDESYYGKEYLEQTPQELLVKARQNDIKIRVLENARTNSREKKRLAIEGKWDVFINLNAQLDVSGSGGLKDENGYEATMGLRIQRVDPVLLEYSLGRAVAEIKKYDAMIREQQLSTKNRIDRELTIAKSRRKQYDKIVQAIASRRKTYAEKVESFADGKDTVDDLVSYRYSIVGLYGDWNRTLWEYYESVVWLDHACAVQLARLGIDI